MQYDKTILDEFQHIPLFEALDDSQLEEILATTLKISLPAKTTLFERGARAEHFYMVHSGQIKLFCLSPQGDEKVMEILYPKQTFAEAVMFMPGHVYPVSAEAIANSEVFRFDMSLFHRILKESQESCFRLLGIMSMHLHAKISDINNLTLHNATYRLIVYLLGQLPADAATLSDIHLSTPKNIIASRLSIKPETFSRILLQLSKQNLIKTHDNDITLLDVDGLRALL
ncbi:Crp/Fnr family transcriptional regulator [Sulfuriflexus mobilis]|uniref:Crp/Fnr family transcriptional regulator n=1 Tax=Sulfuriflexus mobilis TaxID=1811807 RepID=UPI000F81E55C|nr:Crp/Fnr family transcriptional regulator [Sulfuriflexus mobilis]